MRGRFIVTGGAGFVGSHLVAALIDRSAQVVVVDNFSTGHRAAVAPGASVVEADIADIAAIEQVLANGPWDALFHFALPSLAGGGSVRCLQQSASASIRLIEACVRHGIWRFVLSSTTALYGTATMPLLEDSALEPHSAVDESTRIVERALHWANRLCGLRHAVLRYSNAAGADPAGRLGEDHRPETHLIPQIIDAALGRAPELEIHGADYPTPDGTSISDYVHVSDLARMHLSILKQLRFGSITLNLGNNPGHSVLQIIRAVNRVAGLQVPYRFAERRPGVPARLIVSSARAQREAGWRPVMTLDDIVRTALAWRQAHPHGYPE